MAYGNGDVVTYQSNRAPRQAPASRQNPPPAPPRNQQERDPRGQTPLERLARLEATVYRLEESVVYLSDLVDKLSGGAAPVAEASPPAPSRWPEAAPQPDPPVQQAPAAELPKPPAEPAGLKVTFVNGTSTTAVAGKARIVQSE